MSLHIHKCTDIESNCTDTRGALYIHCWNWNREFPLKVFEVKYNHIAATYHQAVVITAAGDSSTQRGGGIGKSLGWANVDLLATM